MTAIDPALHRHVPEGPPPDAVGGFYVSVIDGNRYGLLLGPFDHHADAEAWVEPVRRRARDLDCRSAFYAFGTSRVLAPPYRPGRLNDLFREAPCSPSSPASSPSCASAASSAP